eukprot:SAG11_NODE_315_length_10858_cov_14.578977_10_plen_69_part_00
MLHGFFVFTAVFSGVIRRHTPQWDAAGGSSRTRCIANGLFVQPRLHQHNVLLVGTSDFDLVLTPSFAI